MTLYRVSDEEKLDELLQNVSLGTRKPSVLLNDMTILAGANYNEELIRSLWLRRLPQRMREHVALHKVPLSTLATMADSLHAIMTSSGNASVHAVQSSPTPSAAPSVLSPTPGTSTQLDSLVLENLRAEIAALKMELHSRDKYNDRSRSPFRSQNALRSRSRSRTRTRGYCWYHFRFGEKAQKCTPPCTYSTDTTKKAENSKEVP